MANEYGHRYDYRLLQAEKARGTTIKRCAPQPRSEPISAMCALAETHSNEPSFMMLAMLLLLQQRRNAIWSSSEDSDDDDDMSVSSSDSDDLLDMAMLL